MWLLLHCKLSIVAIFQKLKVRTFWETHNIWKNLPNGFDESADLLSKHQNHKEDFFKLCVLLRMSELYQKNMPKFWRNSCYLQSSKYPKWWWSIDFYLSLDSGLTIWQFESWKKHFDLLDIYWARQNKLSNSVDI